MLPHMDAIKNTAFQRETCAQCCEMQYLVYIFFAFEWNERDPWRSCGISFVWGLIPNCRGWLRASLMTPAFQLLSSQAPFGSFITPLSSGQFTQFNYVTPAQAVFLKVQRRLLSKLFVLQRSHLSFWPFTAGSNVINSAFKQTPPYTLNLLVGQILNGCTWRPKAARWKLCVHI